VSADHLIELRHGEPLIFGADEDKGLCWDADRFELSVVKLTSNGIREKDLLSHDERNPVLARLLAEMTGPDFPVAIGVIYNNPDVCFEQQHSVGEKTLPAKLDDLGELFGSGQTWVVDGD